MLLTDSAAAAQAGTLAGCYAAHQLGPAWQPAADLAAHICKLLRVQPLPPPGAADAAPALAAVLTAAGQAAPAAGEEEEGDDVIDMLLLVLDAANAPAGGGEQDGGSEQDGGGSSLAALEWADSLVRALNQAPGFRDTVLLSLVLGPGEQPLALQPLLQQEQPLVQPGAAPGAAPGSAAAGAAGCPAVRRPLQSYQFAGQERVAVDAAHPALVVHRLPAVIRCAGKRPRRCPFILPAPGRHLEPPPGCRLTAPCTCPRRVDRACKLDLEHIRAHGAAGCIPADRLLPEVAYKLGRAPKYGA